MYSYSYSVVLERTIGSQWKSIDLTAMTVFDIYDRYSKTVHALTHPVVNNGAPIFVDFTALHSTYAGFVGTLSAWLTSIGDIMLPLLERAPASDIRYVRYEDAVRAGYKANLAKIGFNYPSSYPASSLPDLEITRPKTATDVTRLHTRALVSVNGYMHLTDTDGSKTWVKDGGKSLRKAKMNQFGIISFDRVGNLEKIPVLERMVYPEVHNRPLIEHIMIKLDAPIGDRVFMLSVGGYLQMPEEGVCWQTGDDSIGLCMDRLPYVQRYYESSQYLNLDSLGLDTLEGSPGTINEDQLKSDEVLVKYMTLSQTFVVLVDIGYIFTRRLYMRSSSLPGMYTSYQEPTYPQITGYGKVSEYWKVKEDGYWSVNVVDGISDNYVYNYGDGRGGDVINDHRLPGSRFEHSQGYLLEIGAYN